MQRQSDEFLISLYLDGDLDPLEQKAFEVRCAESPELAGLLEQHRCCDEQVRRFTTPQLPERLDAFARAVSQRIAAEPAVNRTAGLKTLRWVLTRAAPLAAAAALALAIGLYDWNDETTLRPTPGPTPVAKSVAPKGAIVAVHTGRYQAGAARDQLVQVSYNRTAPPPVYGPKTDDSPVAAAAVGGSVEKPVRAVASASFAPYF